LSGLFQERSSATLDSASRLTRIPLAVHLVTAHRVKLFRLVLPPAPSLCVAPHNGLSIRRPQTPPERCPATQGDCRAPSP